MLKQSYRFFKSDPLKTHYEEFRIATTCLCNSRYVGHTSQRLQQKIKQLVPKSILHGHTSLERKYPSRSSQSNKSSPETLYTAIVQRLLQRTSCAQEYNKRKSLILAHGLTAIHLSALEATYIKTRPMQSKRICL